MIEHRFIVSGAFQALNAAEARDHFALDSEACELVLLEPPSNRASSDAGTIIEQAGWCHHRTIGPASSSVPAWTRRVRNGRGLSAESAELTTLFLGDYQTHLGRHAAHGLAGGRVVVLDDGQATLRVNAHRVDRAAGRRPARLHPQIARPRYHAQRAAARVLGLHLGDLDRVTFFTVYDLEPAPLDLVVRNHYSWLRTRFDPPEVRPGTLFLGTPLVEEGIISSETYVEILARIGADSADGLWYRAHPREDPARVATVVAATGVQLLELDSIVEYGLMHAGWVPARIATTLSSALDTLRVILGGAVTVHAVPLPPDVVARRWRDWVARSYREMDSRLGVPVDRLEVL